MKYLIGDARFSQASYSTTGQVILEPSVCIFWQRGAPSIRVPYFLLELSWDATGRTIARFPDGELILTTTDRVYRELWRRQQLTQVHTQDSSSPASTVIIDSEEDDEKEDCNVNIIRSSASD